MIQPKYSALVACITLPVVWGCSAPSDSNSLPVPPPPKAGDIVSTSSASATDGADGDSDGSDPAADGADDTSLTTSDTGSGIAVVVPEGTDILGGADFIPESETVAEADQNKDCAAAAIGTSLVGVVLAFTFDVSASMGSHVQPDFSRELKWDPVVAATKTFFADQANMDMPLSATLTFFPDESAALTGDSGGGFGGGGGGAMCQANSYGTPDVALTPLPSDAFGAAIDAITPVGDDDWRLGTPTQAALEGTRASILDMRATDPNAQYVIVLVTDGLPALCNDGTDDIASVAQETGQAYTQDDIPTYVIGIGSPPTTDPNDPNAVAVTDDSLDNLDQIATAGGTEAAHIIDTNDPTQTAADFRAVINSIVENSFSCAIEIPAPPEGQTFDKDKVNVNYSNVVGATPFVNDPTCTEEFAWYYDDPDNPTVILMCDKVCEDIRADFVNEGELGVEFGCEKRIAVGH